MNPRVEHSSFDPKKAVTFDLPNGQVRLTEASDNERAVIVPAAALATVVAAAGETASRELGRSLGRTLGGRVAGRIGNVREAKLDDVLGELATELAIVGLGTMAIERWGRALVVAIDRAPIENDPFLAAVVEGMLAAASGRELRTVPLSREGTRLRVLVGNVASIERVVSWLAEGTAWGEALTRLHDPSKREAS
jgi:hypothetical protein